MTGRYRPPPRPAAPKKPLTPDDECLRRMIDGVAAALLARIKAMLETEGPHKASVHTWQPTDLQGMAIDAMAAYDTVRREEEEREKRERNALPNDRLDDLYQPPIFG